MLMLEIYLPIIMNRIHHNYFNEINYCSKSSKKKKLVSYSYSTKINLSKLNVVQY